jgi:D-3-phosphoglycerate dehydrogenase
MTPARDIESSRLVPSHPSQPSSWQQNLSGSPTGGFSQASSFGAALAGSAPKNLKPFNTQDIKILLLENVNRAGQDILKTQGYQVEAHKTSLPEDQLIEKIRFVTLFLK